MEMGFHSIETCYDLLVQALHSIEMGFHSIDVPLLAPPDHMYMYLCMGLYAYMYMYSTCYV